LCTKENFRDLRGGKGLGDGLSNIGLLGGPLWWGRHRVGFLRFRFWSKSFGLSHHISVFCTKSRFLIYSVYVLIFTCQQYCLLCRLPSLYLYLITYIEWETRDPSRTTLFEGQFRRSRDRVFIVLDGDFDLKNELRQKFSKKLLPGVENVASGRDFLAFHLRLCSITGLSPPL
jgi:hypothetical protein